MDATRFKNAMRATVASVNVITCQHEGGHFGLTATAFASVSADPPSVLICVNAGASACQPIRASGRFCVNVLRTDMKAIATAFGGSTPPEERFLFSEWVDLSSGNRSVAGAAAYFDCQVSDMHKVGSHWLIVGEVIECHANADRQLVYSSGSYGSFQSQG